MRMTVIAGTVALAGLLHLTAAQSDDKNPKGKLATRQVTLLIEGMT